MLLPLVLDNDGVRQASFVTLSTSRTPLRSSEMNARSLITAVTTVVVLWAVDVHGASAEWSVAGFLGAAHTQESSIRLIQPPDSTDVKVSPIVYRAASFEPPIYYGYRIGCFPGWRWVGVEGEFIHLKVIADTSRPALFAGTLKGAAVSETQPIAAAMERFSITHGVNLVLVNAVVRHRVGRDDAPPRWFMTGRVGMGASVPHVESTIAGASLEHYERGAFSVQGAAGVELRLARRVYLAGEYKLTRTVQDVSVVNGSVNTPLTTHHFVTGIVAHLGPFP